MKAPPFWKKVSANVGDPPSLSFQPWKSRAASWISPCAERVIAEVNMSGAVVDVPALSGCMSMVPVRPVVGPEPTLPVTVSPERFCAVAVNTATGLPTGTLPTKGSDLIPNGGYEQRQLQIGLRFAF